MTQFSSHQETFSMSNVKPIWRLMCGTGKDLLTMLLSVFPRLTAIEMLFVKVMEF
jgi:hypothetical protein